MKFAKYEQSMHSGILWVGDLPLHWKVSKIKYGTYVKGRIGWQGLRSDEFIDEGPYLVTGTDFCNGKINWNSCYHIDEDRFSEAPEIHLKENDLLITKDGTIGKTAIVTNKPEKAILNSGIFVTRPTGRDYKVEYMYWVLNSNTFSEFIKFRELGSTIKHLYQATFINFAFPQPPIVEQQAIANFLDHKTSEIDALIADKEKLIELLKEQRQAIITEAVTKGLNPYVKMKDSRVEWIGEIPEHWSFGKIVYFAKLKTGGTPDKNNKDYWEDGTVNWMSSSEVNKKFITSIDQRITPEGLKNSNANLLPINSVMIALNGQGKTKGTVAILKIESTCNQSLAGDSQPYFV